MPRGYDYQGMFGPPGSGAGYYRTPVQTVPQGVGRVTPQGAAMVRAVNMGAGQYPYGAYVPTTFRAEASPDISTYAFPPPYSPYRGETFAAPVSQPVGYPYGAYVPTVGRGAGMGRGFGGAWPLVREAGEAARYGYAAPKRMLGIDTTHRYMTPVERAALEQTAGAGVAAGVAGAAGAGAAGMAATAGGRWQTGGGAGGGYEQAPAGIDPGWYRAFQKEHGGQTPEDFYGKQREGLAEALADLEWSQGFQQMTGREPSQYDWENWYYQSRRGGRPGPPRGTPEYTALRESQKRRRQKWRDRALKSQREAAEAEGQRAPLWIPPGVVWR